AFHVTGVQTCALPISVGVVDEAQSIPPMETRITTPVIHLCLYKNPSDRTYFFVVVSKAVLKAVKNRLTNPFFLPTFSSCGFNKRSEERRVGKVWIVRQ